VVCPIHHCISRISLTVNLQVGGRIRHSQRTTLALFE
jgi:hypothetical protein